MEAKKQAAGEEDLSMEEILQSIRKIIADDTEEGKTAANSNSATATTNSTDSVVASSDILELTDMIEEDGSITNLKEQPKEASTNVDVLSNIDAALKPEPAKEEKQEAVAAPAAPAPQPERMSDAELDALLSKTSEDAALSSLAKLKIPEEKPVQKSTTASPVFRSGETVEDMVEDMLRPMLKEWLDTNLPIIVERIVEREVTRLSRR